MRPLEARGAWLNDVSQPETNSPSSATFFIPWQGFSVKVPREEATKAQSSRWRRRRGRHRPTRSMCHRQGAWGRLLGGARPQPGHPSVSSPFPLRIEVQQCSFSRSGPSSVDTGSPGGMFSCLGAGAGRVQGSSFARHFTAVDFELGPGRPPWPPWLLPGLQAQSVVGGELGWARALHCLCRRLQSRRWPRRACSAEEDSMRSASPGHPVGSFPSSALPVGFCGSFPWGPGPQPCGSMRRKPGSRGVRDFRALHCRRLQFLPWFGLQTTPKNAVVGIWSKPRSLRGRVRVISFVIPSRSRARLTSGRQPTLRDAASHRPARQRPGTPWGQAETRVCPRQPS